MAEVMPLPYGARCSWWDTMDKVGKLPGTASPLGSIPCCPICSNVLFQHNEGLESWMQKAREHAERTGDKDYVEFLEWARGRCFPNFQFARQAFDRRSILPDNVGRVKHDFHPSRGGNDHGRFG